MFRKVLLLFIGIILISHSIIKAEYYPYPIMINHGRGGDAETLQNMRDYFRQNYPNTYPGLIPVADGGT